MSHLSFFGNAKKGELPGCPSRPNLDEYESCHGYMYFISKDPYQLSSLAFTSVLGFRSLIRRHPRRRIADFVSSETGAAWAFHAGLELSLVRHLP